MAIAGSVVALAGLFLTMPGDQDRPVRPTTVSRPSQSTAASPAPGRAISPESQGSDGGSDPEAAAAPGLPASPAAAAVSKPAPGRFVYRRTVESSDGRTEEEVSWLVTHLDGDLYEEVSAKGRDGNPDNRSSGVTAKWAPSGVTRTALRFPSGDDEPPRRCELEPPLLVKPLPLEVGLRWESASACGEGRQRMDEEISGNVVRTERVEVAGGEVDTFVIEIVTGRGQRGLVWFASEGTHWFSPQLGVAVRSTDVRRETETESGIRENIMMELLAWPGGPTA